MDFNKLYTLVIEAEETASVPTPEPGEGKDELPVTNDVTNTDGTGIASPENYGVEPAPVAPGVDHEGSVQTITGYIQKLTSFADEINNINGDGESLSEFIAKIDVDDSAFDGISKLKSKIIAAAVDLRSVVEDLKGFAIAAQKAASTRPVAPAPVVTTPAA
jgi:hypothetical protein